MVLEGLPAAFRFCKLLSPAVIVYVCVKDVKEMVNRIQL